MALILEGPMELARLEATAAALACCTDRELPWSNHAGRARPDFERSRTSMRQLVREVLLDGDAVPRNVEQDGVRRGWTSCWSITPLHHTSAITYIVHGMRRHGSM